MAQGKYIGAIILLFCVLVIYSEMVHASTYVVGGKDGWTYNVVSWSGKNYRVGDILLFYYNATIHNVVKVDEDGYNSCHASAGSKTYNSGRDFIPVVQGTNYFISTFSDDCQDHGMKFTAIAK